MTRCFSLRLLVCDTWRTVRSAQIVDTITVLSFSAAAMGLKRVLP